MLQCPCTICLNTVKIRKTTGRLWNYYRDELSDDTNNNSNKNVINSESFKYKTKYLYYREYLQC